MKKLSRFHAIPIIFFLSGLLAACDSSSGPDSSSSTIMTKVTPKFQAAIPRYEESSSSKSWTQDFDIDLTNGDGPDENEDSYILRYLADDINGVYLNSKIYDLIADLVNSKIDSNYNPSAGVTVSETNSFTTACLGTVTGSFHDLDMGSNIVTLFTGITMENIRILIEKTGTTERVYLFTDVYDNGTPFDAILYTCIIDEDTDTVNFEIHSYEAADSEGSDFKKILSIVKDSANNFMIKEMSGSTGESSFNKAIVAGNLTAAYIRVNTGTNDECFQIKCSDFTKLQPSAGTGTAADWGVAGFPEEVEIASGDAVFTYALDASITSATSLKWW